MAARAVTWQLTPGIDALLTHVQSQVVAPALVPLNASLLEQYRRLIQPILDSLPNGATALRGAWPGNLSGLTPGKLDVDALRMLMMDEHLPIAWVPRAATVELILAAKTPGRRRVIYGQKWRSILEDCEELAEQMDSSAIAPYVRFLKSAIEAVRDGHHEAGQALAATTLDTVRQRFILDSTYKRWIGTPDPIEPDELDVRTFFVICQLWGIHRQFWVRNDDPIPRSFTRHGTVHGVSNLQYTRLNALLGVAHLTSLMWSQDSKFSHRKG
jgi:hypothetical protein